jgi:CheY-like chemotaxis protein
MLNCNSGRYADTLIAYRDSISSENPNGKFIMPGIPLRSMSWKSVRTLVGYKPSSFETLSTTISSNPQGIGKVTVTLFVRPGDPACDYSSRVAAVVNAYLQQERDQSPHYDLVLVDVSVNNDALAELDIRSLPSFVMFQNGRVVYAGPVGGHKVHMSSARVQVIVVGHELIGQVETSRCLKKCGCDAYFCSSLSEALDRMVRVMVSVPPDLIFIASDAMQRDTASEKGMNILARIKSMGPQNQTLPIIEFSPRNIHTKDASALLLVPFRLNEIYRLLLEIGIKSAATASAVHGAKGSHRTPCMGLSPDILFTKMREVHQGVSKKRSQLLPLVGIRLSAEDTCVYGQPLVDNRISSVSL